MSDPLSNLVVCDMVAWPHKQDNGGDCINPVPAEEAFRKKAGSLFHDADGEGQCPPLLHIRNGKV